MSKNEIVKGGADALAVFDEQQEAPAPVRNKAWLDYILLVSGQSKSVTEGKAVARQFQVGKEAFLDKETPVIVLAHRPHANWRKDNETIMESFDVTEKEFQEIAAAEMDPEVRADSAQQATVGYDFLMYLPALNEFGYFYLKKTALDNVNEFTSAVKSRLPQVMYSTKREARGYTWFVPRLREESGLEIDLSAITPAAAKHALDLFTNPRPQGRDEQASEPAAKKGGRRSRN